MPLNRDRSCVRAIVALLVVAGATALRPSATADAPKGPFEPTWESVSKRAPPVWFQDAKFGIGMHWGLYAVPAHQSEWYVRHMYSNAGIIAWHREKFGPRRKVAECRMRLSF